MPIHDWTKVGDWLFHDFHTTWLIEIKQTLNRGLLPPGYHAYAEQRADLYIPDVLTLTGSAPRTYGNGMATVAEPQTERRQVVGTPAAKGRALSIRHSSDRRVVAIIELVSPGNKDREAHVGDFAGKIAAMVEGGVHAAVIDILPPGRHDPDGMHAEIWSLLEAEEAAGPPPRGRPLSFAGYRAAERPVAYVNFGSVGGPLPPIPLFLDEGQYINLPLESTYMAVFQQFPPEDRRPLES